MVLLSLKEIVGSDDYYIDDKTLQIWSFKRYDEGRIITPINKNGYIIYRFNVNGKRKHILYHKIIVKMFIKPDYDSNIEEIDHMNHNRQDNSIENLCVVSRIENQRNTSRSWNGKAFNFVEDIGKSLIIINEEAGIFYSLDYDKFYMFIEHTNKYKELHEHLDNGYSRIRYKYNNKLYSISPTKFRKNLNNK